MPTKLRIPITPDYKSEIPPQKKGGDVKVINSRAHEEILLEAKMLAVPNLYQTTLELGSETKLGITLNKNEVKDYLSGFANESFSLSLILFVIYCHIGERTTRNRENQRRAGPAPLLR